MLTMRDLRVIEFLKEFKVAKTSTIQKLFYPSLSVCQRRLKAITENKSYRIQRVRDNISSEYVYFSRKTNQIKHSLLVSEFYSLFYNKCEINKFIIEPTLGNIRPDALFGFIKDNKAYLGFLEVEISNKGFDWGKYIKFYTSGEYLNCGLKAMPILYVVGNNVKIPPVDFKVIKMNTDFSNLRVL